MDTSRCWTLCALLGAGCYVGVATDPGERAESDTGGHASTGGEDEGEPSCEAGVTELGPGAMARLTRLEYSHAVRDLFEIEVPLDELPDDELLGPFSANLDAPPSELELEAYMDQAEAIAAAVAEQPERVLDCAAEGIDEPDACADAFIEVLGRRAYRRPLSDAQRTQLRGLYELGVAQGGPSRGLELVTTAALESPHFLYHVEIGVEFGVEPGTGPSEALRLDAFSLAARLSFFLWRSIPDDALLDAAEHGELDEPAGLEAQVERMLDDPRAARGSAAMYRQWMGLEGEFPDKSSESFPAYDPSLAPAMREGLGRFAAAIIHGDGGSMAGLLEDPRAFVDAPLASYYGVELPPGPADDDGLYRVDLPGDERAGLLTRAGVMAMHGHFNQTAPVQRGRFVREALLCQPIPDPPPDVDDTPPALDPDLSVRERFAMHSSEAGCASCHTLMDPIGFAFEHYDGAGRYRTVDGNLAVDASGELTNTEDLDGSFYGAIELSERLSGSDQVRACFVRQYLRFALVRPLAAEDDCTLAALEEAFAASDDTVEALMLAVATSESFRLRRPRPLPEESN